MTEIEFTVLNSKGVLPSTYHPWGSHIYYFPLSCSLKKFFEKKLGAELNQPPISVFKSVLFINFSELHCC
jgi:hypothetical protein